MFLQSKISYRYRIGMSEVFLFPKMLDSVHASVISYKATQLIESQSGINYLFRLPASPALKYSSGDETRLNQLN